MVTNIVFYEIIGLSFEGNKVYFGIPISFASLLDCRTTTYKHVGAQL